MTAVSRTALREVMRVPGRLRITWENDTTLKIETDAGQQMRLLRFEAAEKPVTTRTWQGSSAAEWKRITLVDDPTYLNTQFITSTHVKREPDGSKWMPTPCESSLGTK